MPAVTTIKLVFAVLGIAVFMIGAQIGSSAIRWTGIGLVSAGFVLRFLGRRRPDRNSTPDDPMEDQ